MRRVDRQGEVLIWCRKCSGCARQSDELLQAAASGHQRVRQNVETNFRFSKTAGSLPKRQKTVRLNDKRGELPGRNFEDC